MTKESVYSIYGIILALFLVLLWFYVVFSIMGQSVVVYTIRGGIRVIYDWCVVYIRGV